MKMSKIKRAVAVVLATGAAMVGLAVPAHASTTTTYTVNTQTGWCYNRYYVDYNWWEEMWGARDYSFTSASWRCAPLYIRPA